MESRGVNLGGGGAVRGAGVGVKEALVVVIGERIGPYVVEVADVLKDEQIGFLPAQKVGDEVDGLAEIADVPVADEHARESDVV